MTKEVLTIDVNCHDFLEVKGKNAEACMILFDGSCECENFTGKICPSAADTQTQVYGEKRFLSARYILKGKDCEGQKCSIFIENNGAFDADGNITTRPRVITDSKALAWLETADLYGKIEGKEGGVIIHIFNS